MSEINESTRIINLTEASEMDAGMNFVTDSSNGTRKVPITKLIDANLEEEYAAAPAKAVGDLKEDIGDLANLETEDKSNLVAAINEAAQSGGGGGGGTSPSPYTSNPSSLGVASPGSSTKYSKGDHVHPMPSASDVGAIATPSSPTTGQFLKWNGSAWVASDLPVYNGGVS